MNPTEALAKYHATGMKLANEVDLYWDALVGMREPGTEHLALNAIAPHIDRFRDACSDLARATEQ